MNEEVWIAEQKQKSHNIFGYYDFFGYLLYLDESYRRKQENESQILLFPRKLSVRLSFIRLLIMVCFFLLLLPDIAKAEENLPNLSFGSQKVLRNCWSDQELQGRPEDKIIVLNTELLTQPPELTAPLTALCPTESAPPNSIRRVIPNGNKKVIALTFDLCERANEITGYDYEIVNYLRRNKIRATFFACGKWMQSHPVKSIQLMADPLFEIGNHTWTHANLRVISGQNLLEQIVLPQAQYRDLRKKLASWLCAQQAGMEEIAKIPEIPICFRFPYGTCSKEALQTLQQLHLPAIQWDVVTADSVKSQTAEGIAKTVLEQVWPGSIIVCHANGRGYQTAKALTLFVPELQKRGYTFVTVSQILTFGPVFSTAECYNLFPGDNKNYEKIFGEGAVRRKKKE